MILVEAGSRILPAFDPTMSRQAVEQLEELGVVVRTGTRVTGIDDRGVSLGTERIEAATIIWTAGVEVSPLVKSLGAPLDAQGRVIVERDLSIPGHPEAFVIGDLAHFEEKGEALPGVSQVAMQGASSWPTPYAPRSSAAGGPRSATSTRGSWPPSAARAPSRSPSE